MAKAASLHKLAPSLWRLMRHFWPYVRRHKLIMFGAMSALFFEVAMRILEPWPLKIIFDYLILPKEQTAAGGSAMWHGMSPETILIATVVSVVIIAGLRAVAAYINVVGFALIGNRVLTEVRNDVYRHVQTLSLSFHHQARTGDLTVRVISDIGLLQEIVVTAMLPLLGNLMILFGILAVMLWLNWQLALLALVVVPLFWLTTLRLGRRIRHVAREQRQREGAMAATASESLGAIKTVQALSLQENFQAQFASDSNKSLKQGVKAKRLAANLERTIDVLIAIASALVLWYGTQLVLRSHLTPGDLLVFLMYLKTAFKPVRNFAKYTGRLAKASAAGDRIMELLELEPGVTDAADAISAPALRGTIEFKAVNFSYQQQAVLKDLSFSIEAGEHIALIGPSGVGKSTIVNLLLRLYDPSSGTITVDGQDIRRYTLASLRTQISVVLQDGLLFAASVRDNISSGDASIDQEAIEQAARLANADEFIQQLPQAYDTAIGERGATLSNGQRQRIAIARAIIRHTPIVILDEPTSGLDEDNERQVLEALDHLSQGRTSLIITHDLQLAARADHILWLQNDAPPAWGSHSQLLLQYASYGALFERSAMQQEPHGAS